MSDNLTLEKIMLGCDLTGHWHEDLSDVDREEAATFLLAHIATLQKDNDSLKAEVAQLKETAKGDDIAHCGLVQMYVEAEAERDRRIVVGNKIHIRTRGRRLKLQAEVERLREGLEFTVCTHVFGCECRGCEAINHKEG